MSHPRGAPRHPLHQPRACGGRVHSRRPSGAGSRHPAQRATEAPNANTRPERPPVPPRTWAHLVHHQARQSSTAALIAPSSGPYRASRSADCNGPLGLDGRGRAYIGTVSPVETPLRSPGRDIGHQPCGTPRVVPNVQPLQLFAGGIMRGRNRSRARRPMRGREAFRRGRRVSPQSDAQFDEPLRALARLIARQAAREVFQRATSRAADQSIEEGRE